MESPLRAFALIAQSDQREEAAAVYNEIQEVLARGVSDNRLKVRAHIAIGIATLESIVDSIEGHLRENRPDLDASAIRIEIVQQVALCLLDAKLLEMPISNLETPQ
jgi:hypothetical protein